MDGWKASESQATFSVKDGAIVVFGRRSHLFYVGLVANHNFKNFEFEADVMTTPGSNSGIYFHTAYQETGFPDKGFEVQVNNSHTDWKRTGGLYDIQDVRDAPAPDNQWFTERIVVQGKRIRNYVNDKLIVDYTEPENVKPPENHLERKLSSGTFAFHGMTPRARCSTRTSKSRNCLTDPGNSLVWVSVESGSGIRTSMPWVTAGKAAASRPTSEFKAIRVVPQFV